MASGNEQWKSQIAPSSRGKQAQHPGIGVCDHASRAVPAIQRVCQTATARLAKTSSLADTGHKLVGARGILSRRMPFPSATLATCLPFRQVYSTNQAARVRVAGKRVEGKEKAAVRRSCRADADLRLCGLERSARPDETFSFLSHAHSLSLPPTRTPFETKSTMS